MNLYGYAGGDPVNFSDPFGLKPCPPDCDGNTDTSLPERDPQFKAQLDAAGERATSATYLTLGVASGLASGARALASRLSTTAVVHFTSVEGAAAIESSGGLRSGSFVGLAGETAGKSAGVIETFLEIGLGKGAMRATMRVPTDALKVPFNGPITSGGATQFQLNRVIPVSPGSFTPTP